MSIFLGEASFDLSFLIVETKRHILLVIVKMICQQTLVNEPDTTLLKIQNRDRLEQTPHVGGLLKVG